LPVFSNPYFNLVLIINGLLCLASMAVMVWAASDVSDPMPKGKERLMEIFGHAFTLTVGAFVGLLGGRAAFPDGLRPPPEPASSFPAASGANPPAPPANPPA